MASLSWLLMFVLCTVLKPVFSQGMVATKRLFMLCSGQLTNTEPVALASVTEPAQFLQSAAPDLAGPATAAPSCGGCYIVADVAGLVWYQEVFINTAATALVSVGVGNGTSATRTSVIQNEGQFTFNPTDATESPGALTQLNFQPTVNVGGAQLCVNDLDLLLS